MYKRTCSDSKISNIVLIISNMFIGTCFFYFNNVGLNLPLTFATSGLYEKKMFDFYDIDNNGQFIRGKTNEITNTLDTSELSKYSNSTVSLLMYTVIFILVIAIIVYYIIFSGLKKDKLLNIYNYIGLILLVISMMIFSYLSIYPSTKKKEIKVKGETKTRLFVNMASETNLFSIFIYLVSIFFTYLAYTNVCKEKDDDDDD